MKKRKLRLLFLALLFSGILPGLNAQDDTIRSLVITEWRGGPSYDNYIELTNMGDETLDLSRFTVAKVNGAQGQFEIRDGQWFMIKGKMNGANLPLSGSLAPGESYLVMNVGDQLGNDGLPWHNVDMIEKADTLVHIREVWGVHDKAIPEWEVWGKDSIDYTFQLMFNWGNHANVLFYHLDNGDSLLVDGVNVYVDGSLKIIRAANDVAGIPEATATHTLVRKANIVQGNMDWSQSKGVDKTDSEWITIPSTYEGTSFTTAGVHGDFGIDLESDVVDIDIPNAKLTVPWGTYKKDSILKLMTLGPGLGWQYHMSPSLADSAHLIIQDGDVLSVYAAGNVVEQVNFEITVAAAAADMASVYSMLHSVDNYEMLDPWGYNLMIIDNQWIPLYEVKEAGQAGMGSIEMIPYATRVDSLYKNLEKAPGATWEIVWHDGIVRADLQKGDILKVTSEDASVVKEYYLDVLAYEGGDNVLLNAITWPDKTEFLEGWMGDTIPQFTASKTSYSIIIPYGTVNVPALMAHPQDINSNLEIQRAVSLGGSMADRTTVFTVSSESGASSQEYMVTFDLEKDPAKIQDFKGTPFISEIAHMQRSRIGWLEIVNPGNVDLDLSEYLIVRSTKVNPSEALAAIVPANPDEVNFKQRYNSYVPGYKFEEDTSNWILNAGILSLDANVEPVVEPGGVFVMSVVVDQKWAQYYTPEQLEMIDKLWSPQEDPTVNLVNTVPRLKANAQAVYLFKIKNDSVLNGDKPVGDPADYELVDVFGDPVADPTWSVAGHDVISNSRGRMRPKPYIYTGARSLVESAERFGTHADTSDWINEVSNVDFTGADAIPAYIGSHDMDPVTVYLSTISSSVYLAGDGYATLQTIQGDLTSTTVESFYVNINKADPGQALSVLSGVDGSMKDAADPVVGTDTLVVVSADGKNTTKYALVDLPLDTDAVLTTVDDPSDLTIAHSGEEGTITGVVYGSLLSDVVAAVKVPALAVMNIIDGEGNLVSLQVTNYDGEKADTKVGDDIYFEVVAEDRVTKITYKLQPAILSSDAFVISSIYEVDQESNNIANLADGTSTALFHQNIEVVTGASTTLLTKFGHERVDGIVSYDDLLQVVSQDGAFTRTYFLTFLNESTPDANQAPEITLAFSDTSFVDPGTIMLSATATDDGLPPPSALTYLWEVSSNSENAVIESPDQMSTNVSFNAKGSYTVTLSVSDGDLASQADVSVKVGAVGIDQIHAPAMLVYPNPASEKLTLELSNMPGQRSVISIYSITGSAVFNTQLSGEMIMIDVSAFEAGLYFIKVSSKDQMLIQRIEIQ